MLEELYISFILCTIGVILYGVIDLTFKVGDYICEKREKEKQENILIFKHQRGRRNGTYR